MGKGSKTRPPQISPEEEDLRWQLALGHITFGQFKRQYEQLKKEGKIYRKLRYKLNGSTEKDSD